MVQHWLKALAGKVLGGPMLRRTRRPARRVRVCPRLETLETRTVMSIWNLPPQELLAPPTGAGVVGKEPAAGVPEYPAVGSRRGFDVPERSDPGWDKLLDDVLWGHRPNQQGPSSPGGVSMSGGNTFVADPRTEPLAANGRDRSGLRAADPFRPAGSQARPVAAE